MAKRLQRDLRPGAHQRPGAVVIDGRSKLWRNPFGWRAALAHQTAAGMAPYPRDARLAAATQFGRWFAGEIDCPEHDVQRLLAWSALHTLKGRDLVCSCDLPEPGELDLCHGVILIQRANQGA